jgi:hypothetical protein
MIEVVKSGAAMGAQALCTEIRLCHGFGILKGSMKNEVIPLAIRNHSVNRRFARL